MGMPKVTNDLENILISLLKKKCLISSVDQEHGNRYLNIWLLCLWGALPSSLVITSNFLSEGAILQGFLDEENQQAFLPSHYHILSDALYPHFRTLDYMFQSGTCNLDNWIKLVRENEYSHLWKKWSDNDD